MQPKLTIAIPTYNRVDCLRQLLPELIPQVDTATSRGFAIEVIVVDNASPDETQDYVQHTFHDRIRYIRNKANIGGDANFIECVKHANGEYVWLFGDDDIINPGGVDRVVDILLKFNVSLLIAETHYEYSRYFRSYRELLDFFLLVDPIFPVHHSLITANIFLKSSFNIDTAISRLSTQYAHMYALFDTLKTESGIYVFNKKDTAFSVRTERAAPQWDTSRLEQNIINFNAHLAKELSCKRLSINVWLFYRARWLYNLVNDRNYRKLKLILKQRRTT